MASYRPDRRGNRKWLARRKRNYEEHFLGYFKTKEEAVEEEKKFDKVWPAFQPYKFH